MESLRTLIFPHAYEKAFFAWYRATFSVEELEKSTPLKFTFGALLFFLFLRFAEWTRLDTITIEAYLTNRHFCWPHFQSCGEWYFLQALPYGYSQSVVYMAFFALMLLIAYLIYRQEWTLAHILFVPLWLWTVVLLYLFTLKLHGNYDTYFVVVAAIVLFLPYKLFFARLAFVTLYFLAATIKFHEGWILGTYFTALHTGLPFFSNDLAPIATNIVIFSQVVGCWFLLSNTAWIRRTAAGFFILFHLYSGILVQYLYPSIALILSVVLFTLGDEKTKPVVTFRSIVSWIFIALLFVLQMIPVAIPGDVKSTLEGNYYGLYMFEANHQCTSRTVAHWTDGTRDVQRNSGIVARDRCDPYRFWFRIQENCKRNPSLEKMEWTLDHSINGGPFYRIVDTENACELTYMPFSHNEWIRVPDSSLIVGYPVQNIFY